MNEFAGASILVVDDQEVARRLSVAVLSRHGYQCSEASSEAEARSVVDGNVPDLVLTDVTMPGGSGLALVRSLSDSHPDVATVVVTGFDDPEVADEAIDGGAFGYVIKPFAINGLLIAVASALKRRALQLENRAHRDRLEELVRQRTQELDDSRAETVDRLARAVESRDAGTGAHIGRMSELVYELARALGWNEPEAQTLRLASVLHDVGKVAIPDEILRKPGPLTPEERRVIETHASAGHAILAGARSELLRLADLVAWTHHERWQGNGYPRGLAGEQIPIEGRIAAVADVYDALTSERPYRPAFSEAEALQMIRDDVGLDPVVVAALEELCAKKH